MSDRDSTKGNKAPELRAGRFVIAIVACLFECVAWLAFIVAARWEQFGYLGKLVTFLVFLAILGATWFSITGERFRETLAVMPYRKFGQGPLYNQGFAAGRDGKMWQELAPETREQDEYFRGYQDGLCYRSKYERLTKKNESAR